MNEPIVSSAVPITVVGGGEATISQLTQAISIAPHLVAADGGAALALRAGVPLDAVIGDFDSVAKEALELVPPEKQHAISEQMSTDFEKVRSRVRTPLIIGVGFLGGRLDHELAALHALMAFAHQPCLLIGTDQIVFHAPPRIALPARTGDLVSLFPLRAVEGQSSGLEWPIKGLVFEPGRKIGTSNAATGPFEIEMERPGMLVILPGYFMPSVVAALSAPDLLRWPAHAE